MPPSQRRHRQVVNDDSDDDGVDNSTGADNADDDGDVPMGGVGPDSINVLVKQLVRYALACEFSRTPIRRDGIREKVLGHHGREFKKVFNSAQQQLRVIFGMEMVELPIKDRSLMTAEQKRKAAKSQSQKETTSNAWILVSNLQDQYRHPAILGPSKVQSPDGEASYMALYTMIISLIQLSGGELSDPRLRRHLSRLNAAENMPSLNPSDASAPSEKTEVVLQRMVKQGYLVKVTGARGNDEEEGIVWHVGPRGKVEVDNEAIASFIRAVWGESTDDLESKLQTSLKVKKGKVSTVEEDEEEDEQGGANGDPGPSSRRRSSRRAGTRQADENNEDDDE